MRVSISHLFFAHRLVLLLTPLTNSFGYTRRFRDPSYSYSKLNACYVQDHTTWMTNDSAEMNASHSIIEELYGSDSSMKCLRPAQPKGLSEFNYIRFG